MSIKLECNSCGYAELVSDMSIRYCPECNSSDIGFETDPLAESRAIAKVEPEPFPELVPKVPSGEGQKLEHKSEAKPKVEPWRAPRGPSEPVPKPPSRPVRQSSRRQSGYRSGMSEGVQIRIVLGIIGIVMLLSAGGIILSGLSGIFSGGFGGLAGAITLGVIGVIFLAIATKGEICDCC